MCSACLAIIYKDKVLMVKAPYKDHWTFPSGIVDDKESPKAAALRETHEETGLIVDGRDVQILRIVYTASKDGERDRFNFAFKTTLVHESLTQFKIPNEEISEARWVNFEEVGDQSGGKLSYREFQKALISSEIADPYVEV